MKRTLVVALAALLSVSIAAAAQSTKSSTVADTGSGSAKKRGPVFRATKDQITQAQNLLRQRGLYAGGPNGKLDADTRAALKKYQESEGLKITGTLNRATLEKMSIALTDKQRATS